jgi:hypothetical protein
MSNKKYLPTLFLFSPELSWPFRKLKVGKPPVLAPFTFREEYQIPSKR